VSGFDIELFYDGACPVCAREARLLRRLDRRARLRLVDISVEGFDASALGVSSRALQERMHGRLPDGTWVEGVEAFRRAYAALGFGPLVAFSRLPGVAQLLDRGYRWLARNRHRLAGRARG